MALCDSKMLGMNGKEVYEQLRPRNPELSERILSLTSDVINDKTHKFLEQRHRVCLLKASFPWPNSVEPSTQAFSGQLDGAPHKRD